MMFVKFGVLIGMLGTVEMAVQKTAFDCAGYLGLELATVVVN